MDNDKVADIVKKGLDHSIAQTFLIFSGIFVITSTVYAKEYVNLAFFTLIYSFIIQYLTTLRKHESLGRHAVGNHKDQVVLFTLIYISLFVWWSTGIWSILPYSETIKSCCVFSFSLPQLSFYAIVASVLLITIWILKFFCGVYSYPEKQGEIKDNTYGVTLSCKNCNYEGVEISIPRGIKYNKYPCPNCGIAALKK